MELSIEGSPPAVCSECGSLPVETEIVNESVGLTGSTHSNALKMKSQSGQGAYNCTP